MCVYVCIYIGGCTSWERFSKLSAIEAAARAHSAILYIYIYYIYICVCVYIYTIYKLYNVI